MSFNDSASVDSEEPTVGSVYFVKNFPSKKRQVLRVKEELGLGSQGKVLAGTVYSLSLFNVAKNVAVKMYNKPNTYGHSLRDEIKYLKQFREHPNIVRYLGDVFAKKNVLQGFIMERLLFPLNLLIRNYRDYLNVPIPWNHNKKEQNKVLSIDSLLLYVFTPVLSALSHLHAQGILFRDFKTSNAMVGTDKYDNPIIKLVDMGGCCEEESITKNQYFGSLNFKPPECYKHLHKYSRESEAMALGMNICHTFDMLFPFEPRFHPIYEKYGLYSVIGNSLEKYYKNGEKDIYFLSRLVCSPEMIQKKLAGVPVATKLSNQRSNQELPTKVQNKAVVQESDLTSDKCKQDELGKETEVYRKFIDCFIHLDIEKRVKIEDVLQESWIKEDWLKNQVEDKGEEFLFIEHVTKDIINKFNNLKKAVPVLKMKQSLLSQKPTHQNLKKMNANFAFEYESEHPLHELLV